MSGFAYYAEPEPVGPFYVGVGEDAAHGEATAVEIGDECAWLNRAGLQALIDALQGAAEVMDTDDGPTLRVVKP